jgi:hypothetical protein
MMRLVFVDMIFSPGIIAEFELTEFILGFVAVSKPREDCEKAVKPGSKKTSLFSVSQEGF